MNWYLIVSSLFLIAVQITCTSSTVNVSVDREANVDAKTVKTLHQKFETLRRSERSSVQQTSSNTKFCEIEVQEIRKLKGKCIRLFGGRGACTAGEWMDPMSADCEDL